ncbi:MAG: hypothetical protein KTV16_15760 [Acidimicrobiia bacterium]|nr:hypothetical protein [Acidimicrobiia bacterium]MCY4456910.1 hypothetical protein [Acidimicrobiaceae bacterium]
MIDPASVRNLHARCDCIRQDVAQSVPSRTDLEYADCRLRVAGLRLVIECDKCEAFPKDQRRPDLLVFRVANDEAQWIVVEIKTTVQPKARRQIEAGLQVLADSPLFQELAGRLPLAIIAYSRRRVTDLDKYRQPIRVLGQVVPVRVVRCGEDSMI